MAKKETYTTQTHASLRRHQTTPDQRHFFPATQSVIMENVVVVQHKRGEKVSHRP